MTVWIVQALCGPARHCILTAAHEADTPARVEHALRHAVSAALVTRQLNPWCGICGARVEGWVYETGRTPYATMAEAEPALRASEAAQTHTAAILKAQGRAYDAPDQRRN